MKFATIEKRSVCHIIKDDTTLDKIIIEKIVGGMDTYCGVSVYREEISEDKPSKRFCKVCKHNFLKTHSEDELFVEII